MITWENYEEYMMMHADGELTPAEEQALRAFVKKNPTLEKELAAYELTRLTPDTAQVFADKESLLKLLPSKRVIAFPHWRKYSIAAGVAALIFISLFKYVNKGADRVEITKTDTVKPILKQVADPQMAANNVKDIKSDVPAPGRKAVNVPAVIHGDVKIAAAHSAGRKNRKQEEVIEEQPRPHVRESVMELQLARTMPIAHDTAQMAPEIPRDIPAYTVQPVGEEDKETFWDRLPIDDLKKDGLRNVANAVASGLEQVNNMKKDLYRKSISVRIEKRKLLISF